MKTRARKLIAYLLARLIEPTSWAGLGIILTWLGVNITIEQLSFLTGIGAGLAGLLLYLYPQYKKPTQKDE